MSARGAALAATLLLFAVAMFALRPHLDHVVVAAASELAPAPGTDVVSALSISEARVARAPTPAIAMSSWTLLPQPAPATPVVGIVAVLGQPRFSPRIDIEAEVWAAFVGNPSGDPRARWSAVADRLARVGLGSRHEAAWVGGSVSVEMSRDATETRIAVVVTSSSVGAARLTVDACVVAIPVVGVATVEPGEALEAWAWSASAFPGPHRLPGAGVPAGEVRVVSISARDPLTVVFADPMFLPAGTRATPCLPRGRRVLELAPGATGPVVLCCRAEGWRSIEVALASAAARPATIVELGDRPGDYGNSLSPAQAPPPRPRPQ